MKPKRRRRSLDSFEVLSIAWRSIRSNVMRSVLTALGVIIGVAAVVALTAAGSGVNTSVTDRITSLGSNLLTISGASQAAAGGRFRGSPVESVTLGDLEAIRDLQDPRIVGIAPQIQTNTSIKAGSVGQQATVIGTWPDYEMVRNAGVAHGTFFTDADNTTDNRVAVLGYQIAIDLFGSGQAAVGQTFRLSNLEFTVRGVLPDKGNTGFQSPNGQIIIPLNTFLRRVYRNAATGDPTVNSAYVQGTTASDLAPLQADLTTLLSVRHHLADPTDLDFEIQNQADTLESLNSITQTLTLFLGAIAGISLLVGGIGIMNIMLVSVTERTREIGVRKALGAKPRDILAQFLLEAIMLSARGGLIGVLLGIGAAGLTGRVLNLVAKVQPASILLAFGFAAMVGIFFGFYPAQRASRLNPVDALRYE